MINYPSLTSVLYEKLSKSGLKFTTDGYPAIPTEMLLRRFDDDVEMYPISHRHQAKKPNKTILCWYENDELLHRHINRLDDLLWEFREFYAVAGVDLSPCVNSDLLQQKSAILLSQLITAYMALNGIRILANFRTGSFETINSLNGYPLGICYAVGTLGCSKNKVKHSMELMRAKLFNTCPSKLLIYGPLDEPLRMLLNEFAIPFVAITDFKTRCFLSRQEVTYVR